MKETFYFSHDYNARSDGKMKQLIRKCGMEGYGVYWAIVEDLYQNANALHLDCEGIAYDLRCETSLISSVINGFDLFEIKGDHFGSKSVGERLAKRMEKSAAARKSAEKRWGTKNANALQTQCDSNAIKESKGKENKIKKTHNDETSSSSSDSDIKKNNKKLTQENAFEKFWNLYPKKVNKKKAEQRFMNLSISVHENLFVGLDLYIKKWNAEMTEKRFIPGPEVWLNGERWTDEITIEAVEKKSPAVIQKIKEQNKKDNDAQSRETARIAKEKKAMNEYWLSLSTEDQEDLNKKSVENAKKRHKKDDEFMKTQFAKPMIQAELGILIRSKM